MAYKRKTEDEFVLAVNYGYGDGPEEITAELTRKLIKERLKEYQKNEPGPNYYTFKRRVKICQKSEE